MSSRSGRIPADSGVLQNEIQKGQGKPNHNDIGQHSVDPFCDGLLVAAAVMSPSAARRILWLEVIDMRRGVGVSCHANTPRVKLAGRWPGNCWECYCACGGTSIKFYVSNNFRSDLRFGVWRDRCRDHAADELFG